MSIFSVHRTPAAYCACLFAGLSLSGHLAAQTNPPSADASGEVVQLERFKVTSSIGSYAETNTTAATKIPVDFKDLASSLQELNGAFLADLRSLTVEDTYRYVVGMTESSTNNNGFSLRGFSGMGPNQSSLAFDGLPGADLRFGSPSTANVERIEVLKGPTSVLYGQNNPGGLLNVVSKRPQEKPANSIFVSAASFADSHFPLGDHVSFTTTLDSTGPLDAGKHWLYRVILSAEDLHRPRIGDYERNYFIWPSLTYNLNKDTWITVQGDFEQELRRADDGLAAPLSQVALVARYDTVYQEPTDKDRDRADALTTSFGHNFSNGWVVHGIVRNIWHVDTRYALENAAVSTTTVTRRFRYQWNGHRYNFGDLNASGSFATGAIKHTLLIGINGGIEEFNQQRLAFGPNVAPIALHDPVLGVAVYPSPLLSALTDNDPHYYNYGGYISDQFKIGTHWVGSVGFRHDQQDQYNVDKDHPATTRYSQSQNTNLPSFGLVYEPTNELSLYASYCRGFKNSDVTSLDRNGNPGFPPEASNQVEVGVKADMVDHKLSITTAAYDIKKVNVLEIIPNVFLPNGLGIRQLIGAQESKGIELEINYHPVPNWQLMTGWTYDDARTTQTSIAASRNAKLVSAPDYSGNFWTRYNVPTGALKGFGAGLGIFYTASFLGTSTNIPANYLQVPAYARVDAALYYDHERFSYALNIGNVLDRKYILNANLNTAVTPGDPRKVTASVRLRF